ncbi:hypothetical protein A2U01_0054933, partial [Trifolium medium]|nr:hypothetical protein [Trifolium medium]
MKKICAYIMQQWEASCHDEHRSYHNGNLLKHRATMSLIVPRWACYSAQIFL